MRLVIIGAGFAGMYAALSAARLRDIQGVPPKDLEIALVSPEPTLVVRPRLYEPKPETLTAPVSMWPVKRRDQAASVLTVIVKSYQPLQ